MKKDSITFKTILIMLLFIVLIPFLPILISRNWSWWEGWAYFVISVLAFAISRGIAARRNPDILAERAKYINHKDIKSWDKILSPLVGLGGGLIPVTAGIEAALSHTIIFNLTIKIIALILFLFGMTFSSYALIVNRFFSGVVRIQNDRGQKVISNGPYGLLRHPGYAGALLTYWVTPLFLDSIWTFIPVLFITIFLIIRTSLEDKTLIQELYGYKDYIGKVKYRLFPGIW